MGTTKNYSYILTIYETNSLKPMGQIKYDTESNAPSEERRAIEILLNKYPLRLQMYGCPLVRPDMFKGYMFLGRKCGRFEKYRIVVDLNRNENSLPVNVFVDVEKIVN